MTEIGERAFEACTGLTSIVFPKSVKTIGRRAFDGTGLIEVIIPKSVKKVDDMAFIDCHSLKSISIMGSLKIPSGFCEDCESLETVTFGSGVKAIADSAFNLCKSLKRINIPEEKKDVFQQNFLWKVNRIKTDYDWAHPGRDWEPVELEKLLKVIPAEKKK